MADSTEKHEDDRIETAEGFVPVKERSRSHTDVLCVLMLLACWFAMTVVGFAALGWIKFDSIKQGEPMRLMHAIDYDGRVCGYSAGVADRKYAYYMATGAVVCVSSCPPTTDLEQYICYDDTTIVNDPADYWTYTSQGRCMYHVASSDVAFRCLPDEATSALTDAINSYNSTNSGGFSNVPTSYNEADTSGGWFNTFLSDLYTLQGFIFGFGLGISVLISFLYLYFLRIPGLMFLIIWGAVLSILFVLVIGAIMLYLLATDWEDGGIKSDVEIMSIKVCMYIVAVLAALYLCLVLVLRSRIQLALGIIKEAGRALATMPNLILLPVVQAVGMIIFLVPWFAYMVYLASSGEIVQWEVPNPYSTSELDATVTYRTFEYDENTQYAFLYMLFCWFWTSQFIIALGQLTLALSVVCWYFTRDKGEIGTGTPLWAGRVAIWYYSGTAAFGSCVIAIMKTIRVIIAYIQKKCAKSGNQLAVAILCCIGCCVWCLEKFMKFLNKNAYIQTAIHGYSFCKAARTAFFLLLRNILRVAAVNMVSSFVLMMGRLMIPCVTTLLCYLSIVYGAPDLVEESNGIILPMILVFLLAYFVAVMFNELFGMAIETILLCYIADEEMFPLPDRFAQGSLQDSITKTAQGAASAKVHVDADPVEAEAIVEDPKSPTAAAGGGGELL